MGKDVDEIASPIFPIILGQEAKAMEASLKLLEKGFFVPAIRPPSVPKNKSRLRLTLSAVHTDQEIEDLLKCLRGVF